MFGPLENGRSKDGVANLIMLDMMLLNGMNYRRKEDYSYHQMQMEEFWRNK